MTSVLRALDAPAARQPNAAPMTPAVADVSSRPGASPVLATTDGVDREGVSVGSDTGTPPGRSWLSGALRVLRTAPYEPLHRLQMGRAWLLAAATADVRRAAGALRGAPCAPEACKAAEHTLAKHGYQLETLPQPGELWLCPELMGTGAALPALLGKPVADITAVVTQAASDADVHNAQSTGGPFAGPYLSAVIPSAERPWELTDLASGAPVKLTSPEAYCAQVKRNREACGVDVSVLGGKPIAAHVAFQGSGARGKRYVATVSELLDLGIIPAQLSGVSSGSLVACMLAAGARSSRLQDMYERSVVAKTQRPRPLRFGGGLMSGRALVDGIDAELRRLTGVRNRPVTFADLPFALYVTAAAVDDTAPAADQNMRQPEGRLRVFSREKTPRTPVAIAVRASVSLPGVLDNVRVVDPMSGRRMELIDGGWMEVLPIDHADGSLPTVGIGVANEPGLGHPSAERLNQPSLPLPAGRLDFSLPISGYLHGQRLWRRTNPDYYKFQAVTKPEPGQVMLMLPCWSVSDPEEEISGTDFNYEPQVDRPLDAQARGIVRRFAKDFLPRLAEGTQAEGFTNFGGKPLPDPSRAPCAPLCFAVAGPDHEDLTATYAFGDDAVWVRPTATAANASTEPIPVRLGRKRIEALYLDCLAFGREEADLTILGKEVERALPR